MPKDQDEDEDIDAENNEEWEEKDDGTMSICETIYLIDDYLFLDEQETIVDREEEFDFKKFIMRYDFQR